MATEVQGSHGSKYEWRFASWMVRAHSCPTCRASVTKLLRTTEAAFAAAGKPVRLLVARTITRSPYDYSYPIQPLVARTITRSLYDYLQPVRLLVALRALSTEPHTGVVLRLIVLFPSFRALQWRERSRHQSSALEDHHRPYALHQNVSVSLNICPIRATPAIPDFPRSLSVFPCAFRRKHAHPQAFAARRA